MQLAALALIKVQATITEGLSLTRDSEWQTKTMYTNPTQSPDSERPTIEWTLYYKGSFNFDTGESWVVLKHVIETPIFANDIITFGLQFYN